MASTLPEIHLLPTDMQSIMELVKTHDRDIEKKLDEAYHSARFNIVDSSGPVCFISSDLTLEEANKIQEWLFHAETSAVLTDDVRYFGQLVDAWRHISGRHE